MSLTIKELKSKSDAELSVIAEELGLQLNAENTTKNDFITEIIQALEEDKAVALADAIDDILPVVEEPKVVKANIIRKFRLILSNQEGVENTKFVKVQVNGEMFAIPRETEVVVPESVVGVLNNAVATYFRQEGDALVPFKARRFPFQILGEVFDK